MKISKRSKRNDFYAHVAPKRILRRACGKVCHASSGVAKSVAKNLRGSGRDDGGALAIYHCTACEAWHIGHSTSGKLLKRPSAIKWEHQKSVVCNTNKSVS